MDREAYVEKMKAKLDEWNAEIDKLQAQAKAAEPEILRSSITPFCPMGADA